MWAGGVIGMSPLVGHLPGFAQTGEDADLTIPPSFALEASSFGLSG